MRGKTISKVGKRWRKWVRSILYVDGRTLAAAGVLLLVGFIGALMVYNQSMSVRIDPTAYTPLLDTIAKGESNGNYNAYFGNASNTTLHLTDMTVTEVLNWQQDYVKQGHPSSAVGKYQIIRPTLIGLIEQLGINPAAKFDEATQDRMAIALLEKRGALDYAAKKLSRQEFAANLAKEWAALPRVTGPNPEQSYYAGDGINKVRVSIAEVYTALATFKAKTPS